MLTASLKLKSDLFDKYPVEEIENENTRHLKDCNYFERKY